MKQPAKRSSWMITAALCGLAVAYLLLFFLPRMKAIAAVQAELKTTRDYVVNAERLRPTIERLKQDVAETSLQSDLWKRQSVSARGIPAVLGQLNQFAAAYGGTTSRFEPQVPIPFDTFQQLPVTFVFAGSYRTCLEAIAAIEGMPAKIWIEGVKLEKVPESRQELRCELALVIFAGGKETSN